MNIALVWPKSTFLSNPIEWPPLGLFYIGAQLEAQGHRCEFFDLSFSELPNDGEFDQLWLSATGPQMKEVKRVADITRDWKTKTVLGGAGPWANPKTFEKLDFDIVVAGESDHPDSVGKLVRAANRSSTKIDKDRLINLPITRGPLDWVVPPIRRWASNYHSYMTDQSGKRYRMVTLFTSRGCPMESAFCESGRHGIIWDRLTRYEPVELVERQIKECVELGFTGLAYYDDVFILNRNRTLGLLELHKKYNVAWRCFLRSDILCKHGGREYLERMRDAGLIEIFVGVESASNVIKRNIHKGTTIEEDGLVLKWCTELGVRFKGSFILGLPGETYETMQATREWILKNRPHRTQVDRLIPFPGTPLTDHPEEYDLTYEKQIDENFFYAAREDINLESFVSTSHLTREQIDSFYHDLIAELKAEGIHG